MGKPDSAISVDYAKCPPCSGLVCIGVCPMGVLEEGKKKKPQLIDASSCTFCGVCADLCPSKAITVSTSKSLKKHG